MHGWDGLLPSVCTTAQTCSPDMLHFTDAQGHLPSSFEGIQSILVGKAWQWDMKSLSFCVHSHEEMNNNVHQAFFLCPF